MKTELIKSEETKEFKPFTIKITCETIEEARLLSHLSAHSNLQSLITESNSYWEDEYNKEFSCEMGGTELWKQIDAEIKSQGYEL